MFASAFNKFYWGFFFIMIDFRFQGIDILPDIIGYCMFAAGFTALASASSYFEKNKNLNLLMTILSIFQIYERPAQGSGFHFGTLGPIGFLIGIASAILSLVVVYNLFMGIKDLSSEQGQTLISEEAEKRWIQYLILQLAGLLTIILIIIPPLAIVSIIAIFIFSIALTIIILGFMKRCGTSL